MKTAARLHRWLAIIFVPFFTVAFLSAFSFAKEEVEERDDDGDGFKETQVHYDNGKITKVIMDKNKDGQPDTWVFFKNGVPEKGEKDGNYDGKIDTWIQYDSLGDPSVAAVDKYGKGRPNYWVFVKNGRVIKREWDRNFDGKPDLRAVEDQNRLIENQYDNDFDGNFEKTVKAPEKTSAGRHSHPTWLPRRMTGRAKTNAGP